MILLMKDYQYWNQEIMTIKSRILKNDDFNS